MTRLALILIPALVLSGPARPVAADPARELLAEVAAAYRGLNAYQDEGRLLITVAGATRRVPMAIALQRPNRVQIDAGAVVLACDGESLATWNLVTKSGTRQLAPAVIRPATLSEGSLGAMLLGGPGGRPAEAVLAFLFAPDAAATLLVGGARARAEADRDEGGRANAVLRIDQVSGPDLFLGIDRETKLLRWVELAGTDPAPATIRWEAGTIARDVIPADRFGTEPPAGVVPVAPLREDRPAARVPVP